MTKHPLVDELYLRLRLPVIVAPMFLISGPQLVIAAALAGVLGALPASNARTIADLATWLSRIERELTRAGSSGLWAINMIVNREYPRFDAELDLVCEHRPRIVITALGNPARVIERVHAYGGAVFADVTTPDQASRAIGAGVDGLTLVASGAGGHTGQYSAFAFVEEVRCYWDGPLALGGGIGGASAIRAALALGADLVNMGTHFIAARESLVGEEQRAMLLRTSMSDIVTSASVTGIPANWIRESLEAAGYSGEIAGRPVRPDFSDAHGEAKAWKNVWGAGHGVGSTRSVRTVAEIVEQLSADYAAGNARPLDQWPRRPVA